MQDQLISFETAVLAKEKGFNIYTDFRYTDFNGVIEPRQNVSEIFPPAPTQSLLQKWLRETQGGNIQISIGTTIEKPVKCWVYYIQNDKGRTIQWNTDSDNVYNSYEEALEVGLLEALKLINNADTT